MVPRENDDRDEPERRSQRHEQIARDHLAAVRDREDQQADAETEQAAARERRQLDDEEEPEHDRQLGAQPVAAAHAEVQGEQDEQRDDQHDPEVVGVAGQRVRPVHALAADRPVDVDRARAAGERLEHDVVEVPTALCGDELQDAVDRVEHDPAVKTPIAFQ